MQILEIILYSRQGKKRVLPLRPGSVNIITGQSHTGKTALIPIVSYCLGGGGFHVPEGRIVESVAWFGLLLQVGTERIFVARENPYPGRSSTSTAYLARSVAESPLEAPGQGNVNIDTFEDNLSRLLGIAPNLHVPSEASTRLPLSANIRHALFYCFQHQTEIASNQVLFHRQSADFLTTAIKDTLPYFLGAIREEELALEEQLSVAKRKVRLLENQVREKEQIQGDGISKASALLREAISVGLLPGEPIPDNIEEVRGLMQKAMDWSPERGTFTGADEITGLQQEVEVLQGRRRKICDTIRSARVMSGEAQGFVDEAKIQAERLESIGLFDENAEHAATCPICSQHLTVPLPQAKLIQESVSSLHRSLAATERERPRLREYIEEQNSELEELSRLQAEKENAIIALQNEQESAQRMRDLNSRRAKVVGRISLYLESVQPAEVDDRLNNRLAASQRDVQRLTDLLNPEDKAQRLKSILSRLGMKMSEWAKFLQLEFSDSPLRLDLTALTVFIDAENRPVPLLHVGSGENWLGLHLVTHFALHRHFRQSDRPVPGFLFLDQPTQVYFPPEKDPDESGDAELLDDDDRQKVARLFELIFQVTAELAPGLQIIVTDHADFNYPEFQDAVVERWRGAGNALVPQDW